MGGLEKLGSKTLNMFQKRQRDKHFTKPQLTHHSRFIFSIRSLCELQVRKSMRNIYCIELKITFTSLVHNL